MNELTHLDLFSGIGGFALAAQRAGFRTVGFSEVEPYACRLLAERFPGAPNLGDVRNRDAFAGLGVVTVLTGGFPCQPWSVAGKQRGAADDRHLWPAMLGVIEAVRPTWIIGENVFGIVSMGLDHVLADLEATGYSTQAFVVPACAVDAKHRRDRVWIVGWNAKREYGEGCSQESRVPQGPYALAARNGQDVAYAAGGRRQGPRQYGKRGGIEANSEGEADYAFAISQPAIWCAEPSVGRVADGIPNRAHRLKGLGNAIVPQVAEPFFHWIAQIERGEIA